MMPHHPPVPKAPLPTREIFDPFNSSSTGHQRAENRLSGSTSWRESRSYKLAHQFRDASGRGGSQHLSDLVGAGSVSWRVDGRKDNREWEKGAPGLREQGWQDIRGLMSGSRKRTREAAERNNRPDKKRCIGGQYDTTNAAFTGDKPGDAASPRETPLAHEATTVLCQPTQMFSGLTIYLNGSTAPEVSDYKLKQLFVQHGGHSSIALGRRTVTHVILGKTCGGGLASSKIHKEVMTVGGKGIKYVTAQWVLDSVERGVRQPEGQYMPNQIAGRIGGSKQTSVRSIFATHRAVREQD